MTQAKIPGLVSARDDEIGEIRRLSETLGQVRMRPEKRYYLTDSAGEQRIELPESVFEVLRYATRELAKGRSVTILQYEHELTTQQAANILNVSRPFLVGLLEEGKIPYAMVGTHRRIRMGDLLEFKSIRDRRRRDSLQEVRRVSEALGLYDHAGEDEVQT